MNRKKEDFRRALPFGKESVGDDILCPVAMMDIEICMKSDPRLDTAPYTGPYGTYDGDSLNLVGILGVGVKGPDGDRVEDAEATGDGTV